MLRKIKEITYMYLYTYEKYSLPELARWLHLMIRAKREKSTNKMAREQRGKYIYIYLQWNNNEK